jgi:hypothetical protein
MIDVSTDTRKIWRSYFHGADGTFCVLVVENDKIISSFEIYHPKNTNHNQYGNHNDSKVWNFFFFF